MTVKSTKPAKRSMKSHKTNKRAFKKRSLSKRKMQRGGSEASNLVMDALASPVMNDYVSDPRIRDTPSCQDGGSTAFDMVTSQLTDLAKKSAYKDGDNVQADINSLKLYAPSGGFRKNKMHKHRNSKRRSTKHNNKRNTKSGKMNKSNKRNNKRNNKKNSKKNNSKKNNYNMKGGSAWIASQYSLGNINASGMSSDIGNFSESQGVSRDILMNPPTMGLAGSGSPMTGLEGGNVTTVGAPLV